MFAISKVFAHQGFIYLNKYTKSINKAEWLFLFISQVSMANPFKMAKYHPINWPGQYIGLPLLSTEVT